MVVDRGSRVSRQVRARDGGQAGTQHVLVFPWDWRKVHDTRRERIADRRRGRLNLPGTLGRAAPGASSSRTRRPQVFPRQFGPWPGFPRPLANAVTH